jgi:hypothetical protein
MKLQALLFLLALIVRAVNRPADYDSDDELINPRQQARQPLLNRQAGTPAGLPVAGAIDQRPSRNDAWSARMREKVHSLIIVFSAHFIKLSILQILHVFVLTSMHTEYLRRIALDSSIIVRVSYVIQADSRMLCGTFSYTNI